MIKIQVVNRGHQQLPAYATPQSAGMDLRANLEAPITLHPMERRLIPTGLHIHFLKVMRHRCALVVVWH